MDGLEEPVLFMHPIKASTVRATVTPPSAARIGALRFGLADASVSSDNDAPVVLVLRQGPNVLARAEADNQYGLRSIEFSLTSTASLVLEISAEQDGARVFGWDLDLYR